VIARTANNNEGSDNARFFSRLFTKFPMTENAVISEAGDTLTVGNILGIPAGALIPNDEYMNPATEDMTR